MKFFNIRHRVSCSLLSPVNRISTLRILQILQERMTKIINLIILTNVLVVELLRFNIANIKPRQYPQFSGVSIHLSAS